MRILAAIDFSPVTERLVEMSLRLARTSDIEITLLHVAAPDPDFVGFDSGPEEVRDQVATEHRKEHHQIQALAERLRSADIDATGLLVQGGTVEAILKHAEKYEADIIMAGSHGHGAVYDLLVGSVSEGLVRGSNRPVLLVPARS